MTKSSHSSLEIVLFLIMFGVSGLSAQIIYNGNFSLGGNTCQGPTGWVTNNNVQLTEIYQPGNTWIDITGCVSGNGNWMQQEVSITPGTIYFLRMDLGTWSGWDDEDAGVDITIDGQPLGTRIFNDSFTHNLNMKLCWVTGLTSCAFVSQKNKVTIRITGNGKCTKTSPPHACSNPVPGVMAIDNVIMDSIRIEMPQKTCMVQGKASLGFNYTGFPLKYTTEWLLNGVTVGNNSTYEATQPGMYTLRVDLPCQRVERTVVVGTSALQVKTINLCQGDSAFIKGKYRHASGDYSDSFKRTGNCDSIIRTELRIHGKPIIKPFQHTYYICEMKQESIYLDAGVYQSYKWYPGGETSQRKVANKTGRYWVSVGDNPWCRDSLKIDVLDNCDPLCFIPNAFSPNGDGSNDLFPPSLNGISEYRFEVYNRWGELLYISEDHRLGWDGYYRNELCQQGVYLYLISFTVINSKKPYSFSGTFTLMR